MAYEEEERHRWCYPSSTPAGVEEKSMTVTESFSGKRTAEIVGISYRQLDYWARTDLIRPSVAVANGSGSRRQYSYQDLLELKVVKSLLDAGLRLEAVRQAFVYLRTQLDVDVAAANLVINGSHSVVTHSGEELVDILQNGQGVLNVLPLAGVKQQVDAAIVKLHPTDDFDGTAPTISSISNSK